MKNRHFSQKYLRIETLPTLFCPGCFNGVVINALSKALEEEGVASLRGYVFVSGIGCSSWIPSPYILADSLHVLHGRAVAVAMGVKLANPKLEVIVIGGDGDLASIGISHLIHAARRNLDIVVIMVNNLVYGMTRGQQSPTTPRGLETTTTPYGSFEYPIDMCRVLRETNANYVARWTIAHFFQLKDSIREALFRLRRGFRYIEVVAPCTTYVARRLGLKPSSILRDLLKNSKRVEEIRRGDTIGEDSIVVGIFKSEDKPGYIELYQDYSMRARGVQSG